ARVFLFLLVLFLPFGSVLAQDDPLALTVRNADAEILSIDSSEEADGDFVHYTLKVRSEFGVEYLVDTKDSHQLGVGYALNVGDVVLLAIIDEEDGPHPYLTDIHREHGMVWAFLLFVVITLIVGLLRGLLSLLGLLFTTAVLLLGVFPMIIAGSDPLMTTLIASALILLVNMHLSHGLKRRTFLAFLSTLGGLGFVYVFTQVFLYIGRLSGVASDEGALLFWELDPVQAPVGILAAGIILGAVGVLDDVAMTQAELVEEISETQPELARRELYSRAMRIGRHHVASTVNTLVLVYAGAALPVFLLFMQQSSDISVFFNNELVAEEIMRILAGTCALVLTVPLSTWFAIQTHERVDKEEKTP
ncbi:MAG: YibE/F family protein, partial [bacterium]|nr:YibE/F family protein [bacterium]